MKTRSQYRLENQDKKQRNVSSMKKKQARKAKNEEYNKKSQNEPQKKNKKQKNVSASPESKDLNEKKEKKKNVERVKSMSKNKDKIVDENNQRNSKSQKKGKKEEEKQEKKEEVKKQQRNESKSKQKRKSMVQQKSDSPSKITAATIITDDKEKKSKEIDNKTKDNGKDIDTKVIDNGNDKVKQNKKQQIKKLIVKGAAPVDEYFDVGKDFHVLVHQDKVYSITLNQSNISHNNNKYYNLQILQHDKNSNTNYFFTRWGRVGTPGQKSTIGPFSINVAIKQFNDKFQQKHVRGEYRQIQLSYGDDDEQKNNDGKIKKDENAQQQKGKPTDYEQSKLPKSVKSLVSLIFDLGMMNKQMKQIGFNVNKMPLGKLSVAHIKKGFGILKQLYDELEHRNRQNIIEQLTNEFYSLIPHDVGFKNMKLYKLDSLKKVKDKLEMLESLSQIKIATEILSKNQEGNKIDNHYKTLNRRIQPIQNDSATFKLINDYLQTTHASTHKSYQLELVNLFEIHSDMENNRFNKDIPNKMLLWHGSRLTNFVGILSQGLRIAPPQAPVTGYMFGKGVYFADMSSKSANYCFTSPDNNTGILLLCEVALGNFNEKMYADYNASNLPDGKHSTKGVGRMAPKSQNYQMLDGMIIPMGPGQDTKILGCSLQYNQFIVYDVSQIRIRYLLRTKFNYGR